MTCKETHRVARIQDMREQYDDERQCYYVKTLCGEMTHELDIVSAPFLPTCEACAKAVADA